jgi:ATP-dependent RNA helicase MSS116
MLLLAPFEEHTMRRALSDVTLIPVNPAALNIPVVKQISETALVNVARHADFQKAAEQAYGAWLGFYNSNLRKCGWDKPELVVHANEFSRHLGLLEVPYLEKKTVGKMGLKGTPGLKVR